MRRLPGLRTGKACPWLKKPPAQGGDAFVFPCFVVIAYKSAGSTITAATLVELMSCTFSASDVEYNGLSAESAGHLALMLDHPELCRELLEAPMTSWTCVSYPCASDNIFVNQGDVNDKVIHWGNCSNKFKTVSSWLNYFRF